MGSTTRATRIAEAGKIYQTIIRSTFIDIVFFSIRNRWIEECAASLRERSIVLVGFDTMRQRPP
ncbi:hypothetical protein [Burkholderia thailandensis]|uniref:hypothetical protein n=1 Tax=Burkholderia thailandensis TaxID=57975 RepID=UPI0001B4122A|nr:hypothetical protein [Burkholderia thailandensis]AOJ47399.1 hypothetical protein WJ27_19545 [Burkholderia thailandensis]KVG19484.1 hypothetical protein WJ28_04725 [Burkholderia thailandensis]MCS3396514.1 hypothetical protein [Burkholderia thailandensis]MCS6470502.1 hypothetical protein [Burkholderia thailandensis]MCS6499317.1 hypothetical protein [Burkholderia thailandensis]